MLEKKRVQPKKIVINNKNSFPKNDLDMTKIIVGDKYGYGELSDTYCPMANENHAGQKQIIYRNNTNAT